MINVFIFSIENDLILAMNLLIKLYIEELIMMLAYLKKIGIYIRCASSGILFIS